VKALCAADGELSEMTALQEIRQEIRPWVPVRNLVSRYCVGGLAKSHERRERVFMPLNSPSTRTQTTSLHPHPASGTHQCVPGLEPGTRVTEAAPDLWRRANFRAN